MNRIRTWGAVATALAALTAAPAWAQEEQFRHVPIFDTGFEDGTLQGWGGRGTGSRLEKLEVVSNVAHSGTKALKISDRSTTWQGPIRLVTDQAVPGDVYRIGVWVYYDEGPAQAAFTLSIERSFKDEKAGHKYQNVLAGSTKKGEWGFITAEYTVGTDPTQKSIWVYVERPYKDDASITADDKISFYVDDISVLKLDPASRPMIQEDIPNLAESLGGAFALGAAVSVDDVDPATQQGQLLMKHFNALVAGNTMKWDSLQPKEGQFTFAEADKIVDFAELTGMTVRGHTLIWHNQTPAWVFQDPKDPTKPASKALLTQRLKAHIAAVVGHYRGRVASWDVVNEAVSDASGLRTGAEGSKWFEILGPEFIEIAFKAARAADPDAELVYNDYNLEGYPAKRAETVKLVKALKAKGIPIDAVGLQMHINVAWPSVADVGQTIADFAALGVKVVVTELDLSIYTANSEAKKPADAAVLLAQAQRYKDLFAVFANAATRGWLDTVMVWGLADSGSWLNDFPVPGRADAPLFFDRRLQAKPAFWAVVDPTQVKGLK